MVGEVKVRWLGLSAWPRPSGRYGIASWQRSTRHGGERAASGSRSPRPSQWALRDGGMSAGGLASNFWGENPKSCGRDFARPVPETFAMVDGRRCGWLRLTAGRARGGCQSRWLMTDRRVARIEEEGAGAGE